MRLFCHQVAIEGIENIRTVAALTKEETFVQWYKSRLQGPYKYVLSAWAVRYLSREPLFRHGIGQFFTRREESTTKMVAKPAF